MGLLTVILIIKLILIVNTWTPILTWQNRPQSLALVWPALGGSDQTSALIEAGPGLAFDGPPRPRNTGFYNIAQKGADQVDLAPDIAIHTRAQFTALLLGELYGSYYSLYFNYKIYFFKKKGVEISAEKVVMRLASPGDLFN